MKRHHTSSGSRLSAERCVYPGCGGSSSDWQRAAGMELWLCGGLALRPTQLWKVIQLHSSYWCSVYDVMDILFLVERLLNRVVCVRHVLETELCDMKERRQATAKWKKQKAKSKNRQEVPLWSDFVCFSRLAAYSATRCYGHCAAETRVRDANGKRMHDAPNNSASERKVGCISHPDIILEESSSWAWESKFCSLSMTWVRPPQPLSEPGSRYWRACDLSRVMPVSAKVRQTRTISTDEPTALQVLWSELFVACSDTKDTGFRNPKRRTLNSAEHATFRN